MRIHFSENATHKALFPLWGFHHGLCDFFAQDGEIAGGGKDAAANVGVISIFEALISVSPEFLK